MRGFTLIEVVISVFIIGMLVVLSGAMVTAAPLSRQVRYENLARTIAAGELERVRALGYDALPATGAFTHARLADLPAGSGYVTVSEYNDRTKEIVVTVSWRESAATAVSTASLTALVTAVGGLP
ncbi:MAG TPA: prepilin-type N-terminal cleavage/methylation domain-containing protein [Candidatus Paceibacterota bacterium]|jgi:prepilin-type N-terminal cleavage/methylation domain-containing protein